MKSKTPTPLNKTLKLTIALPFLLTSALSAQTTTIDSITDARINGTSGSSNGTAVNFSNYYVGDSSTNPTVFAALWKFDISSFGTEITDSSTIVFEVEIDSFLGDPHSVFPTVYFGLLDTPDDTVATSDYQSNTALGSINMTGTVAGSIITFDVTSVVKSTMTDNVGFIMKIPAAAVNNNNGSADLYEFVNDSANLQVSVPEPSSYALIAGCMSLGAIVFQSRRHKRARS